MQLWLRFLYQRPSLYRSLGCCAFSLSWSLHRTTPTKHGEIPTQDKLQSSFPAIRMTNSAVGLRCLRGHSCEGSFPPAHFGSPQSPPALLWLLSPPRATSACDSRGQQEAEKLLSRIGSNSVLRHSLFQGRACQGWSRWAWGSGQGDVHLTKRVRKGIVLVLETLPSYESTRWRFIMLLLKSYKNLKAKLCLAFTTQQNVALTLTMNK